MIPFRLLVALSLHLTLLWKLSYNTRREKIMLVVAWLILLETCDLLAFGLYGLFCHFNFSGIAVIDSLQRVIAKSFFSPLYFTASSIFTLLRNKMEKAVRHKLMILFVAIPLGQIPLLIGVCYFGYEKLGFKIMIYILASLSITLCSNFLIYPTLRTSISTVENQKKLEYLEQERKWEYLYYQMAVENAEKISHQRHDLRNQLQLAYALAESDSESAHNLLCEMKENLADVDEATYCKNKVVNMILTIKCAEARHNGVKVEIKVTESVFLLPLSDLEWSSLLSILLDHAIEDCNRHSEKSGFVSLEITEREEYYIIRVTNSCRGVEWNGFDDNPICSIIEKYGGKVKVEQTSNMFTVELYFIK